MSATKQHVRQEVKRLSIIPLAMPQDDQAARELIESLLRNCQSNEHVTAVITQFVESAREWKNLIAELVAIARSTQKSDQPPAGCDVCALGPDLDTGEMRWASHVAVDRNGVTSATRCFCERGRWLAAETAARRKQPAPEQRGKLSAAADFARRAAGDVE